MRGKRCRRRKKENEAVVLNCEGLWGRLFVLHRYVDVSGKQLGPPGQRAEEA